jgi:peptidoglycan/LPS O-acetylase OafA/YrhL
MHSPGIDTSTLLVPEIRVLVAYAVFFAVGWALHGHADRVGGVTRGWTWRLGFGVVLSAAATLLVSRPGGMGPDGPSLKLAALAGIGTWFLIIGLTGLFLRHLNRPIAAVRYVADASYWVYLVHLPVVVAAAGLTARLELPVGVKFALVLAATTLVALVSYDLIVRSTFIGIFLNGRRLPRMLFASRPRPSSEVNAGPR